MGMETALTGILACNLVFGVAIVICNKAVVALDGFNFIVVLTLCHFLFTLCACTVMAKWNVFVPKQVPWMKRLMLSSVSDASDIEFQGFRISATELNIQTISALMSYQFKASLGSIVFMNLNLAHNSVGFYQLSKLMCIPVIIAMEYLLYNKFPSAGTILTVTAIITGVGAVGATDVTVDSGGLALATVAVIVTAVGQILCSHYQRELECDAMQLLYSTCHLVTLGLLAVVPVFHDVEAVLEAPVSLPMVMHILLSCLCALGINVTNYIVLGKTSALTYQVLGHFKTVLVLCIGAVLFKAPYNNRLLAGTIIALTGVVGYTELNRREKASKGKETANIQQERR